MAKQRRVEAWAACAERRRPVQARRRGGERRGGGVARGAAASAEGAAATEAPAGERRGRRGGGRGRGGESGCEDAAASGCGGRGGELRGVAARHGRHGRERWRLAPAARSDEPWAASGERSVARAGEAWRRQGCMPSGMSRGVWSSKRLVATLRAPKNGEAMIWRATLRKYQGG